MPSGHFVGAYLAIFYLMVLLLLASGLDYVTAWSATAASLNNLGPGLGEVAINFAEIVMASPNGFSAGECY